jgi:hypothetical protein
VARDRLAGRYNVLDLHAPGERDHIPLPPVRRLDTATLDEEEGSLGGGRVHLLRAHIGKSAWLLAVEFAENPAREVASDHGRVLRPTHRFRRLVEVARE